VYDSAELHEAWALVERFAGLDRTSGSEDERRAAEYSTGRLETFGVEYDRHDPELVMSVPNHASVRTVTPVEETLGGDTDRPAVKTVSFWGNVSRTDLTRPGSAASVHRSKN
jgi:hypothetical protein